MVKYIKEVEGIDFQIVDSEKYGIKGMTSFKALIPASFKVDKVEIIEDLNDICPLYTVKILNKDGDDAMDGANILLWNSELYSTAQEESVCLADEDIDNGILVFDGFVNIPPIISSKEILKYM